MKAYVLLNTEFGYATDVTDALDNIKEIKNIYNLYGVYDFIVEVEAETVQKIKDLVTEEIRRIDNVNSTITLLTYGKSIFNE